MRSVNAQPYTLILITIAVSKLLLGVLNEKQTRKRKPTRQNKIRPNTRVLEEEKKMKEISIVHTMAPTTRITQKIATP